MELVVVELDAGAELDATECAEVADAELVGDTDLVSVHSKRMEHGRDGRHESGRERHTARVGRGGTSGVRPTSW
jgi:hypothetical protein